MLTGATGYIGGRLLPLLAEAGHTVIALVRSANRLNIPDHLADRIAPFEADLLNLEKEFPKDIDAAYYLVHSMTNLASGFSNLEAKCAENFTQALNKTQAKQVIYLSGLSEDQEISEHMSSRHRVEEILSSGNAPLTVLRAGIIIGSGSASFEIMRDLVEKLPVMVAPKWVYAKCQPIAIADVLFYLSNILGKGESFGNTYDIGGPEVLTYRNMLIQFGKIRGFFRLIIPVPVLTPHLSSLWLYLVTSVNFSLAQALVHSLKTNAVCKEDKIKALLPHECLDFRSMIENAFEKIAQNAVLSSWKDAMTQSELSPNLSKYIEVPKYGCLKKVLKKTYPSPKKEVMERLWSIGGDKGWYTMNWAWGLRGQLDKLIGGVGIRRGRTHPTRLKAGDVLDFWRVIHADKEAGHLLLYAEMKLPGEAWIEWKVEGGAKTSTIEQNVTFRPKGVVGRLYWYVLVPIHHFMFQKMIDSIGGGK